MTDEIDDRKRTFMPRRPNSAGGLLAAVFMPIVLILSGCTSASTGAANVDTAGLASMSSAAASSAAAEAQRRSEQRQAELVRAGEQAAAAVAAAEKDAAEAAKARAEAAKAKAAKAAKAKAAKAKAAKAKAAKAKAAKAKAAKAKAAKAKAAKAKAARDKAAKLKADAARFDPLTGGIRSNNPVVAVKIDNTSAGRPQYGLNSADVVYVEQVEGGLTRLIALFHSQLPTEVGPVRSVRTTDVEVLRAYGTPLIAFSGGAGGPLAALAASPLINASGYPGYWRSSAKPAPYNLHLNVRQLVDAAPAKPAPKSPGFTFANKYAGLAGAPTRKNLRVVMEAGDTGFTYDAGTDSYRVNNAGVPAVDPAGNPVATRNVLVQRVVDSPDGTVDTNGQPSMLSRTMGKGDFALFRNGKMLRGRWFRFTADGPTKFFDLKGKPIPLNRGRTWVMLAPQTAQVSSW